MNDPKDKAQAAPQKPAGNTDKVKPDLPSFPDGKWQQFKRDYTYRKDQEGDG